ncbi:hypothetical protein U0070_014082, partial [Myodes glareolus]
RVSLDPGEKRVTGVNVERRENEGFLAGKESRARRESQAHRALTSHAPWALTGCPCLAAGISPNISLSNKTPLDDCCTFLPLDPATGSCTETLCSTAQAMIPRIQHLERR